MGDSAASADASAASASPVRLGAAPRVPAGSVRLGPLPTKTQLRVDVVLRPRDPAGLARLATALSTPGSASYRHFLSREEFASMFGPTAGTVDSVVRALRKDGLKVVGISANRLSIGLLGSAASFGRAFDFSFARYRLRGGRVAFAANAAPLLGGDIARSVQAVLGLDSFARAVPLRETGPAGPASRRSEKAGRSSRGEQPASVRPLTTEPQACSAAVSAASSSGAFTADQLASAYQFPAGLYANGDFGSGVTVALAEWEGNQPSDEAAFQSCYGTNTTINYVPVDGGVANGEYSGETQLDIETIIGLAPEATIDVYQDPNPYGSGWYNNLNAIVSDDAAQVVSISWGQCEYMLGAPELQAENTVFEEAALQGQTVFASAGDEGSEGCGALGQQNDPSSQPYVTSVGGTRISELGPPPTETVWNDDAGATGGGISSQWAMPPYQLDAPSALNVINGYSSAGPCSDPAGQYCREVPDVSADASPYTGYEIYSDGGWLAIGGTSLSSPLWAALIADADSVAGGCGGSAVGFANPALYELAGHLYGSDYAAAFNDITTGNNNWGGTGPYPAGPGYDLASGLGTPNAVGIASGLCSLKPTSVTLAASANPLKVGATATLTATITPAGAGGTVWLTSNGAPISTCQALPVDASGQAACTATFGAGTYSIVASYEAALPYKASGSTVLEEIVSSKPAITSPGVTAFPDGQSFSYTIAATGYPTPTLSESGTLPSGVSFVDNNNGTATLSGLTNVSPGVFPVKITVATLVGKVKQAFSLSVVAPDPGETIDAPCQTTTDLRSAVASLEAAGGGTLDLASGCTFDIAAGADARLYYSTGDGSDALPAVDVPITIDGNGSALTLPKTAAAMRLFEVQTGGSLSLDDVTLSGGNDESLFGGGAVLNYGSLSTDDATFESDMAANGGDDIAGTGTTSVTGGTFIDRNEGETDAIYTEGSLVVAGATFTDDDSGAIYNQDVLSVADSTFSHDNGGAVTALGSSQTIADSTFSDDSGPSGAAVLEEYGSVVLVDDTVSGNTDGAGGAVLANDGTVDLIDSTLVDNVTADGEGYTGSSVSAVEGGTVNLAGDVMATKYTDTYGECGGDGSPIVDGGYNFADDSSCGFTMSTSKVVAGLRNDLGKLAANGGPVETVAEHSDSPTKDVIPSTATDVSGLQLCGGTDARGVVRPQTGCDAGSFQGAAAKPLLSPNFAGYVGVPAGGVTSVTTRFTAPSVTCASSTDNEDIGFGPEVWGNTFQGPDAYANIQAVCINGDAFYQIHAFTTDGPSNYDFNVTPGDKIVASITVAGGTTTATITDLTTGTTETSSETTGAAGYADDIYGEGMEYGGSSVPDFGSLQENSCQANGEDLSQSPDLTEVNLKSGSDVEVAPSELKSDSQNFSLVFKRSS